MIECSEDDFEITSVKLDCLGESDCKPFHKGCFNIEWGTKKAGFGNICFWIDNEGKLNLDAECMSDKFILNVFNKLIRSAKLDSTSDEHRQELKEKVK